LGGLLFYFAKFLDVPDKKRVNYRANSWWGLYSREKEFQRGSVEERREQRNLKDRENG
jgi:hypothetical protein